MSQGGGVSEYTTDNTMQVLTVAAISTAETLQCKLLTDR